MKSFKLIDYIAISGLITYIIISTNYYYNLSGILSQCVI